MVVPFLCWNYLFLSQKMGEEPDPQKRQALVEAVRTGSVVAWRHFNMHGEYDFSDDNLQDSVGFRLPRKLELVMV